MFKWAASIVRRINVDALNLARELLLKYFEGKQVIAKNEPVVEQIVVGNAVWRMVGLLRILQQNPRLQLRPILLPNPREFKLGFVCHDALYCSTVDRRNSRPVIPSGQP